MGQMSSHDKIIFHKRFGAFHITPRIFSKEIKMKDTTEILHLMEEGTKCQDHDMNRAKEAFRRAQVSFFAA